MNCKECKVTNRCVNDGDRIGTAKYVPCFRDSFYDSKYGFCDRENATIVVDECFFCIKCVCKKTNECRNPRKEVKHQ